MLSWLFGPNYLIVCCVEMFVWPLWCSVVFMWFCRYVVVSLCGCVLMWLWRYVVVSSYVVSNEVVSSNIMTPKLLLLCTVPQKLFSLHLKY